jgi:hypothetical protein
MPRVRPHPRQRYLADIGTLRPGCCAVCGEAGSLIVLSPRWDRSVHIELHAACQPIWYRKRGARLIRTPISPPPPAVAHMPQRHRQTAVIPRFETLLVPPPDDAA